MSFDVRLFAHDTSLIGSGSYTSTSGATGAVEVRGFVVWRDSAIVPAGFVVPAQPEVVLNFRFGNRAAYLTGGWISGGALTGTIAYSTNLSSSYGVWFTRTPTPPL